MEKIYIESEYIKLSQFLKFIDLVFSGGEAKIFLENNEILINGEKDNRKGRKLYKGDIVEILDKQYQIC
ncbi:MAG: S4 domain-containing protein YaaA [Erysipelotrichaceae bacterium]|nr:S4 domain-containing protein YaaA [Erysipelotrichaceae bacterium]